ncbi:MAG: MYG1 family protein [Candidatus Paceibacterota bacterium]
MFWHKKKKLVTHNGGFHSDDIFACATLQIYLEKIGEDYEIIRTRDEKEIKDADFVFDVGGVHDSSLNRFDHHQKGGAGTRENSIPYAAFGLVWKKFGEKICENKEISEEIDRKLAQPVDANDNGLDVYSSKIENVSPITFQDIAGLYYPYEDASEIEYYRAFTDLVLLAKRILQKSILKIKRQIEVNIYVKDLYEKAEDNRIVVVDKDYQRFELTMSALNLPELLYVVYPSKRGMTNGILSPQEKE